MLRDYCHGHRNLFVKPQYFVKMSLVVLILVFGIVVWADGGGGTPKNTNRHASDTYEAEILLTPNLTVSPEGDYVALTIPPSVYKNAKGDLSDLRLLNDKGENLPYAFLHERPSYLEAQTTHELTVVEARREKSRDVYDFKTGSSLSQDILLDGLDIWVDQEGDYLFEVIIWGSYDGLSFEKISAGTVYRVKDNRNSFLDFDQSHKFTTYRIETNQPTTSLVPLRVSGKYRTQALKPVAFEGASEVSYLAKFSQVEEDKITKLTIEDGANLPVTYISLETKTLYRRAVRVYANSLEDSDLLFDGEGARFNLDNGSLIEPPIGISSPENGFKTLVIEIENKDDAPLKIDQIRVTYQPNQLVFKILPNQKYRLSYGDFSREAPQYDLPLVVENLQEHIVAEVTIGSILQISKPDIEQKIEDSKLIFNFAIIIAALLLGSISLIALKNNKEKNKGPNI